MAKSKKISKKMIAKEFQRCKNDPVYFIKTYVRISHPQRGLIRFNLYPFQENLIRLYETHRQIIVVKGRQLGISTLTSAYILWFTMFHQEKMVLSIATKEKVASKIVQRARRMFEFLPDFLKNQKFKDGDNLYKFSKDSTTSYMFEKVGSQAVASGTTKDAGRSDAVSLLVIDEAAHVENMDDTWTALAPTMAAGGRCIAFSSPNGQNNWFYKTYDNAIKGENDFFPVKLPWQVHPERDQAWFEEEKRTLNNDAKKIAQEHEADFLATGETVIDPQDLIKMHEGCRDPMYRTYIDRNYWIWETAVQDHAYLISADVATGAGRDHSGFHVIDLSTMEQVAEYKGKLHYEEFAQLLAQAGREYGMAYLVVENNNIGAAVLNELLKMDYPNIFFTIRGSGKLLERFDGEYRKDAVPGFATTTKSRPLIINKLEQYIRTNMIKINSTRLHKELTGFVWKGDKPEGPSDDLTIAFAIACWTRETALLVDEMNMQYSKRLLKSMGRVAKTIKDFSADNVRGIDPTTYRISFGSKTTSVGREEDQRKKDIYNRYGGQSMNRTYGASFYKKYAWLLKD